jgi:hypothetical protein
VGQTKTFTASAFDQHGAPFAARFVWSSDDANIATINSNGVANGIGAGVSNIRASASGITSRNAVLTVTAAPPPPDFKIATSPLAPASVAAGGQAASIITIAPTNGFNGTVNLSCGVTPAVTQPPTCLLNPNFVNGGSGTSILVVSTSATTPTGAYTVTVAGSGSANHSTTVSLTVTPTPTPTPTLVSIQGKWTTLPYLMPNNPVHAVLLRTGEVFMVSGSGDDESLKIYNSTTLDPITGTITTRVMTYDSFCAGLTILSNGNPFMEGGSRYDEINSPGQELGLPNVSTYDLATNLFVNLLAMAHGRWYATATELGDGRVMVDSGWDQTAMDSTVEIFTLGAGWSPEYPMNWNHDGVPSVPPFYMRQHVLPDGTVFYSGQDTDTKMFDPTAASTTVSGWTHLAWTNYGRAAGQIDRAYGTSVLLPLTPANNYDPRVMIMGGDVTNSTDTTELIDLGPCAPTCATNTPTWQWGPKMSQRRVRNNAILLPNGKVLALGGSVIDEEVGTYQQAMDSASLNADLYDPATNTFSPAGALTYPRLDHTVTLLLPDATVWVAGNQGPPADAAQTVTFEHHMEIYQPAYLFNKDGSLATRPVISSAPTDMAAGNSYTVDLNVAGSEISSVVLVKPGATTHSFNTDQREVVLTFTATATGVTVTAPPNSNIVPPGYYMMFVVNTAGVPSVATFVKL